MLKKLFRKLTGKHKKNENKLIIPIFLIDEKYRENSIYLDNIDEEKLKNINLKDIKYLIDAELDFAEDEDFIEISFIDGGFEYLDNDVKNEVLNLLLEYKEEEKISEVSITISPDNYNLKNLRKYKKNKIDLIEIIALSSNKYILNKSGRNFSFQDVREIVKELKKIGLEYGLQIILGLPDSNALDEQNTARAFLKLKPHRIRIYNSFVVNNTKIEELYQKNEYQPLELDEGLEITKNIYNFFEKKEIPEILIGVEDNYIFEKENPKYIMGPYHKEFDKMLVSNIWYEKILNEIEEFNAKIKNAKIFIHPKSAKYAIGYNKNNMEKFKNEYDIEIQIEYDMSMNEEEFKIEIEEEFNDLDIDLDKYSKKSNKKKKR